jgi:gliding motility-associated-like protein
MQKPPQWINADYATVNENGLIDLSFTVDPESEIDHFDLERREGYSGTFNSIFQISGNDSKKITYTDKTIRKNSVYFYRLTAVNNCNIKSVSSNNASNIDLNTINTGNEVILRWNNYKNWNGSVASYRIFMDTGNSFAQFHVASPSDTIYSVSIPGIMYNLTRGEVCFYVSALETGNPHGISGESDSDTSCISIDETVTVPNIFTPDGNGKNDQFKLVLTFAPASYHLLITDQHRKILFETRDYNESWDGMTEAGPLSQGVYLWFLRLKTPSGKSIIRTGTVTIIKN